MNNQDAINALRFLGVDMINKANSGHPGIVLGAAPTLYTLYTRHLRYHAQAPQWFNRDRFVMAAGHGSALLYAMLHLAGYDVNMDDLKAFRQWGSRTPGHPEYGHTDGVDATSGPLGQGIAMAAGMAIAEAYLAERFNRPGHTMVDHCCYALCGDGDLQEGVTQEAMSLAGHLGLHKLIVLYDSNDIQLDGPVDAANSENARQKFEAMNWQYILVGDGEDTESIDAAIEKAKLDLSQPSIIEIKTVIGYGSPNAGDCATHGAPLGEEDTEQTRQALCYLQEPFTVDGTVYDLVQKANRDKGEAAYEAWAEALESYRKEYPEEHAALARILDGAPIELDPADFDDYAPTDKVATRASSGEILKRLQKRHPELIGGSADLTKSTKVKGIDGDFSMANPAGRNINFGVREHAMAALTNGICLHGLRGFAGGFFIFSDYMRPAMRLSALMGLPAIYCFTHDSVAVGEDGPTHEPVEQIAGLRAVPGMDLIRPADVTEVKGAWRAALGDTDHPSCLVLTRQGVPSLAGSDEDGVARGAYVIAPERDRLDCILLASGSEVSLAVAAQEALAQDGIDVRVVSMPSMRRFDAQDEDYRQSVLPTHCERRFALEMGASFGWGRYLGIRGDGLFIDRFGASAPGAEVIERYGFSTDAVCGRIKAYLDN